MYSKFTSSSLYVDETKTCRIASFFPCASQIWETITNARHNKQQIDWNSATSTCSTDYSVNDSISLLT